MEPIAHYEVVWFEGRSQFELFSDSVRVTGGAFLENNVEAIVPLAGLQVRADRVLTRSRWFFAGIWITTIGFFGYVILVEGFRLDPVGLAAGLFLSLVITGVSLSLATFRKKEFAQVLTDAGVPALWIARRGRQQGDFEHFVEKLLHQIKACKGLA